MSRAFARGNNNILDDFLDDIEDELEIPETKYDDAERSYKSVGTWLDRQDSTLHIYRPTIYVQGSFRLGTAIKPVNEEGEYDVDAVCELASFPRASKTQNELKSLVGAELRLYQERQNMKKPLIERHRCWTLTYSEGSQFHLDVVPSVKIANRERLLRYRQGNQIITESKGIFITDDEHPYYRVAAADWSTSNPKGYSEWFLGRVALRLRRMSSDAVMKTRAAVEEIPEYKRRTPLQSAVKFLKRHRDIMFSGDFSDAPVSVIITTLAAHAYSGEETTSTALYSILSNMGRFIDRDINGKYLIPNPSNLDENFADKWNKKQEKATAFYEWLGRAQNDFAQASKARTRSEIGSVFEAAIGSVLTSKAFSKRPEIRTSPGWLTSSLPNLIFRVSHRRKPQWEEVPFVENFVLDGFFHRDGFRERQIFSGDLPLEKRGSLRFVAKTQLSHPFKVYWQIVNTGRDAEFACGLRGIFENLEKGGLSKTESTLYSGQHSIQCFIVKNGKIVGKSDVFIVNIK